MARVHARGRQTLVEVTREITAEQLQAQHERQYAGDERYGKLSITKWERITRRLMSDRTILEKIDMQFQPDWLEPNGRKHYGTWKVRGKLKSQLEPADFAHTYNVSGLWTVTDYATATCRQAYEACNPIDLMSAGRRR